MSNPYESPQGESASGNPESGLAEMARPLSLWFTMMAGAIGGGVLAATIAFCLAIMVLVPPISHSFGLGGEFDGLWLYGIPIFALPGGVVGGLVMGGCWKRRHGMAIGMVVASLPAAAYFFANAWNREWTKNPRDVFVSVLVISLCMLLSGAVSVKLVGMLLAAVERYRATRRHGPRAYEEGVSR